MDDYKYLLDNADTEAVAKYAAACIEHGSLRAAARALGVARQTIQESFTRQRKRLGITSDTKGVSQYYDKEGKPAGKWVITRFDDRARKEAMDSMFQAMLDDLPKYKPVKMVEKKQDSDLVNLYSLFDFHLGQKSWPEETGDDWNLNIAQETMFKFFDYSIARTPKAHTCIINLGGDFLHFDGMIPETPTSKHVVDADTRMQHVIRVALITIRQVINMCLAKYKTVHLLVQEGNHDIISSAWLRETMAHCYQFNKRIHVNTSANPFYAYEWGNTALFMHHGHNLKRDSLDDLFASQFRGIYGRTKYNYAHCGHYHHKVVKESRLMTTYQHGTITAKDSYAARHGFLSQRCAEVHTYSKKFGLCNILPVHIDMIE